MLTIMQFLFFNCFMHFSSPNAHEENGQSHEDRESLFLVKKIFLNNSNSGDTESSTKNEHGKQPNGPKSSTHSSLLYCLFSSVHTDTRESVEFLLQELLFRFVQNESFNKSDKIKLFNEKTLMSLIKLYEWVEPADEKSQLKKKEAGQAEENSDQALVVHQMVTEFLKILFCSTRYGINFYDRTLNIDQSTKNFNHLIFSVIINIQRPSTSLKLATNGKVSSGTSGTTLAKKVEACAKTNDMIDELLLKTLKVCPDLIQRFLKVKYKKVTFSYYWVADNKVGVVFFGVHKNSNPSQNNVFKFL